MPLRTGESSISFVLPIRPRPSARSVPRWRSDWPIWLRTCVSFSFATRGHLLSFFFFDRLHGLLVREHVVDAAELEHRAHAAAGDHAGTGRGRAKQHACSVETAERLVRDRLTVLRH